MEVKLKINDEEMKIKQSVKALMMFESISKRPISQLNNTVTDIMVLFYSVLAANNKTFKFNFDEFIDYVDEHPELFEEFNNYLASMSAEQIEAAEGKKK